MSDIPAASEPTPVPDSAWTGRSWWKACCTGCCLGIVLLFLGFTVGSYVLSRNPWVAARWATFRQVPHAMWERARTLLPR